MPRGFGTRGVCVQWPPVDDRRRQLETWCEAQLGPVSGFEALPVEASTRRFYRVYTPAGSHVAMDAPPATENNTQFRGLSERFRAHGVPVPEVEALDDRGFFLVTDFGDRLFSTVYAEGGEEDALELALQALVRIQAVPAAAVPPYTAQRFRDELEIFTEWLVGALLDGSPPAFLTDVWRTLVEATQEITRQKFDLWAWSASVSTFSNTIAIALIVKSRRRKSSASDSARNCTKSMLNRDGFGKLSCFTITRAVDGFSSSTMQVALM